MSDAEIRRNLWDRAANTWRRLVDTATVAWDTSMPGQASASIPPTASPTVAGLTANGTIFSSGALEFYAAFFGQEVRDDANSGPFLTLDRNSASPAAADGLGESNFAGRDSNGNITVYASQSAVLEDPTDGSEDGRYFISIATGGAATAQLIFVGNSTFFPAIGTTANAANAFLDGGAANQLLRSTSARRAKREMADLPAEEAAGIVQALRPISYKSAIPADDQDLVHLGLVAEDVAAVDPRLVQWGYHDNDYAEEIVETPITQNVRRIGADGRPETVELRYVKRERKRTLNPAATKSPLNVAYGRLAVLLLAVVRQQEARIAALEARGS